MQEFDSGVVGSELPSYRAALVVAGLGPGGGFRHQDVKRLDSPMQRPSRQQSQFRLCNIQPTAVLRCVVNLQSLFQASRFSRCEPLIQRTNRMRIQIGIPSQKILKKVTKLSGALVLLVVHNEEWMTRTSLLLANKRKSRSFTLWLRSCVIRSRGWRIFYKDFQLLQTAIIGHHRSPADPEEKEEAKDRRPKGASQAHAPGVLAGRSGSHRHPQNPGG